MLSEDKNRSAAPTRKNVGSLNPSKEQGARSKAGSELPGLIFMDSIKFYRFTLNFMNFVDLGGFWGECYAGLRNHLLPLQERMLDP